MWWDSPIPDVEQFGCGGGTALRFGVVRIPDEKQLGFGGVVVRIWW